jgi:hypothetical protein
MITSLKYTHDDLLQLPDDGKRPGIIDGELYVTPPPVNYRQKILFSLTLAFGKFLETHPSVNCGFFPRI